MSDVSFELGSEWWMAQVCRVMRDMTAVVDTKGDTMRPERKNLCRECEECAVEIFETPNDQSVPMLQLARLDALVRSVYNDVLTKEQRKKCGVWQQGVSPMAETPFVHHGRMRRLRHVWKTSGTTIEL